MSSIYQRLFAQQTRNSKNDLRQKPKGKPKDKKTNIDLDEKMPSDIRPKPKGKKAKRKGKYDPTKKISKFNATLQNRINPYIEQQKIPSQIPTGGYGNVIDSSRVSQLSSPPKGRSKEQYDADVMDMIIKRGGMPIKTGFTDD
jgi:hypothetical protein